MRHSNTVKHDIRLKGTKAYYLPAQSSVSTSGTAGVDTSTVMLLQYTKDTMLRLPSWLSVLPMLCIALSAAVYLNTAIMTAQRAEGRDRPVKVERHTLMNALQQDELSSGLQQQDAIWLKSWQLPVINSIPSVFPQAFLTHSLPLCWTKALLPISKQSPLSCFAVTHFPLFLRPHFNGSGWCILLLSL